MTNNKHGSCLVKEKENQQKGSEVGLVEGATGVEMGDICKTINNKT